MATERAGQEMVVAARMRIRGGEFGVAERAGERHDGAQNPGHEEPADIAGDARHHRRRLEDAGADDDADDDPDRIGGTQQRRGAAGATGSGESTAWRRPLSACCR